jgi:hypothetical protein
MCDAVHAFGRCDPVLVGNGQQVDERDLVDRDKSFRIGNFITQVESVIERRQEREQQERDEHGQDRQRGSNLLAPGISPDEP